MKNKLIKIIFILLLGIFVFSTCNMVFAISGSTLTDKFDGNISDEDENVKAGMGLIKKVIGPILSAVRIIATGVSIIMITFLGIKYMAAAPSEKANIKNQLITFTIGAAIVVGTTSLLDIIKNFATSATTT